MIYKKKQKQFKEVGFHFFFFSLKYVYAFIMQEKKTTNSYLFFCMFILIGFLGFLLFFFLLSIES